MLALCIERLAIVLFTGTALWQAAPATSHAASVQDILNSVNKNAEETKKLKDMLNSPDPSIRLATYRALLASDDQVQQQLAIEAGLMSSDSIIQNVVVSGILARKKSFNIRIESQENGSKSSKDFVAKTGGMLAAKVRSYNMPDGTFEISVADYGGNGQYSGLTWTYHTGFTYGEFSPSDGQMKGYVRCGDNCVVSASFSLQ